MQIRFTKLIALAVAMMPFVGISARSGDLPVPKKASVGSTIGKVSSDPDVFKAPSVKSYRNFGRFNMPNANKYVKAPSAPVQVPEIYGGILSSNDPVWNPNQTGVYRIPDGNTTVFTQMFKGAEGQNLGGGVGTGPEYFSVRYFEFYGMDFVQVYGYDTETWEQLFMKNSDRNILATDVSYDPVSENIYGCFYSNNSDNFYFGIPDYRNGTRTEIAQVEKWNAFAIDRNGQAFAINMKGELLKVDKETGATTLVGETGVVPKFPTSATFDYRSGMMYWTVCPEDEKGYLYQVDPLTAVATLVTEFPNDEQVNGLWIPAPEAEDDAPAAVSDVTLDFPEGTLSGAVIFTVPSVTFGGAPLSGELTCHVMLNGEEIATESTHAAAECRVPVTVPAPDLYTFVVTVSNSAGVSPKFKTSAFIGKGVPESTEVTMTYADGKFSLSWTPVVKSANGGYLNPDEVTYRVVAYPDQTEYNTSDTRLEIPMAEPEALTTYYFEVTALYDELRSAVAQSDKIVLGAIVPPFTESFDSGDIFASFTVVDANNDGKTWKWNDFKQTARANYAFESCDDWLITPPVRLKAGYEYRMSFDLSCYGEDYPERIEVFAGEGNTVESMTSCLMEPTVVTNNQAKTFLVYFTPEKDGKYYFGFHQISDADMFYLDLDNLTFAAGTSLEAPAAASDFKATADFGGANRATLTLTAPERTIDGGMLESLTKIELFRDEAWIHTFEGIRPGEALSFEDASVEMGRHTYSAVAYAGDLEGKAAVSETFVGINVPGPVTGLRISEDPSEGSVTVTWNAPEFDRDGNPINPDFVTYTIYDVNDEVIAENVRETCYSYLFTAPGEQEFARMAVKAVTSAGASDEVYSALIPVGTPYSLPYADSFNDDFGGIMGTTMISGYPNWVLAVDYQFGQLVSQDDDDSFLVLNASTLGNCAAVYTGKIKISGCENPQLSFHVFNFVSEDGECDDTNTLEVEVKDVAAGTDYELLSAVVNNQLGKSDEGWCRVVLPMDKYEGKVVQVRFKVTIKSYQVYAIDNILVGDLPANDLSFVSLSVPEKADPDKEFNVVARVSNVGLEPAVGASVEFSRDGEVFATAPVAEILPGTVATVSVTDRLDIFSSEVTEYTARVVFDSDENPGNNESKMAALILNLPDFPAVTSLSGETTTEGVRLKWDAIDLTKAENPQIVDDFEDYEPFKATAPGEWTFIDRDKGPTGVLYSLSGSNDNDLYSGMELAFTVMDSDHPELNGTFAANSGTKYLAAFYNTDSSVANDDWAISPRLSGNAQTISFQAKSYNTDYGVETFEVLYSTGSLEPDDFILLESYEERTGNWRTFSVALPEGAVYAAIHYNGDYQYMFFVDDFTYVPAPLAERMSHIGYNVYRDGVKVNNAGVETNEYVDTVDDEELHTYHVTALYDKGESVPSNAVTVRSSGLTSVSGADLMICSLDGAVVVEGCRGMAVSVHTAAGVTVYASDDAPEAVRVPVSAGVYLVRVGASAVKVSVK